MIENLTYTMKRQPDEATATATATPSDERKSNPVAKPQSIAAIAQPRSQQHALQTCLVAMKMLKPGNAGTVPELHAMDDEQG